MRAFAVSRLAVLLSGALGAAGCGSTPAPQVVGPDTCAGGEGHLRQRLGPEFAEMIATQPLPRGGCALVFTRVAEEMPEELEDADEIRFDPDHELAFAFARGESRVTVDTVPRSSAAPGPVTMAFKAGEVTGDGVADLIIEEKQGEFGMTGYRGIRIFDVSQGQPKELFAERLSVTTPEGLTLVPAWSVEKVDGAPAVVFDGAGTRKVFAWQPGQQRFVLDASKGSGAAKPAPAAAASADEPASPTADAPAPEAEKAEKAAKEKKPEDPLDLDALGL